MENDYLNAVRNYGCTVLNDKLELRMLLCDLNRDGADTTSYVNYEIILRKRFLIKTCAQVVD